MNIIGYHHYTNGYIAVDSQNRFVAIVMDVPSKYIARVNKPSTSLVERDRKVV